MPASDSDGPGTPITGTRQLIAHHAEGESPRDGWLLGTEYEKIAVHRGTAQRLGYEPSSEGPGISTLLTSLAGCCGWSPVEEAGAIVALSGRGASVTLEPGGQFELSGAPMATLHDMVSELRRHERELQHLAEEHPIDWLWVGCDPLWDLDHIPWMPKKRYGIMRRYLPTKGRHALRMMKQTCTVQANLDYADEADMGRKLRVSSGVSSIVTAMFANSPLQRGKPSGFKSFRGHIWEAVDPDRCGLLPWVFDGDPPTYERYVRWAVDVPLFFILRGGQYLECTGLPFSQLMKEGYQGHGATMDDWELHLSTLFPDVRMKTYLEMRSADCVKPELLPALPALWKGLLYDGTALDAAWDLVARWGFDQRLSHRHEAARDGLAAPVPGKTWTTAALAGELVAIARYGLNRIADERGHEDEGPYLDLLASEVAAGRCPADHTLAWYGAGKKAPEAAEVVSHYQVSWD